MLKVENIVKIASCGRMIVHADSDVDYVQCLWDQASSGGMNVLPVVIVQ